MTSAPPTTPKATPAPPTPKATCTVCGRVLYSRKRANAIASPIPAGYFCFAADRGDATAGRDCLSIGYVRAQATADRRGKLLGANADTLSAAIRAELEGT